MNESPAKVRWSQAWHSRYLSDPSGLILLAANLIPLNDRVTGPYQRRVVLRLTIISGGMISLVFPGNRAPFILLVDPGSHARKNFKPVPDPWAAAA